MKTRKRMLGDLGEDAAVKYLRKNKYRILERNFMHDNYEIDIIAKNKEYLVFVEVKTRTRSPQAESRYGRACAAVDQHKKRCLFAGARRYLALNPTALAKKQIRMDVIEVYYDDAEPPHLHTIHHMPDAFRME